MNDLIVAYGGYFDIFETSVVCTYDNDVTLCITPDFCNNNQDLYGSDTVDEFSIYSFHGITNNSYFGVSSNQYASLKCYGEESCHTSEFSGFLDIQCQGAFSCRDSTFALSRSIWCIGAGSCYNIYGSGVSSWSLVSRNIYAQGLDALGSTFHDVINYMPGFRVDAASSFAVINTDILLELTSYLLFTSGFTSSSYYGYWNVSVSCVFPNSTVYPTIYLSCDSIVSPTWINFDSSCFFEISSDCLIHNTTEKIDSYDRNTVSMVSEMSQLMKLAQNYSDTCDSDSDDNLNFDIGYRLYAETDIENEIEYGLVCCRGYQSCAYTQSILTQLGSVICSGVESCIESELIWTGDDDTSLSDKNIITGNQGHILCIGASGCQGSTIQSAYSILCATYSACDSALILSANKLYCTDFACSGAFIRKVNTIYIIESNNDITIYSGYIGTSQVYFRGKNSGTNTKYVCNNDDFCDIYCGHSSCDSITTTLYCYGKCNVTCEGRNTSTLAGNVDCVNIISSLAPTVPPTNAPSISPTLNPTLYPSDSPSVAPTESPTVPPTNQPSIAPTDDESLNVYEELDDDVSYYFNWMLFGIFGLTLFIVIVGCTDAQVLRRNELFHWPSVLKFGFYTNDFLSGTWAAGVWVYVWAYVWVYVSCI